MALKELWLVMAKHSITSSLNVISGSFGLNFTLPKFQEDMMEHLGARAHYRKLDSCSTKTPYLPKAPLHLLETLAV